MKKWFSLPLFAILLVACSAPAVNTSVAPTLTAILLPPTETPIPTATSTPTKTPNLNMPANAMGKDAQGNYIKTVQENGKNVQYTYYNFTNDKGEVIYQGWLTSQVENGSMNNGNSFPGWYHPDLLGGNFNDAIPLSINSQSDLSGVPFIHQNNYTYDSTKENYRLSTAISNELYHNRRLTSLSRTDLFLAIENQDVAKATYSFTTPDGVNHNWVAFQGYEFNWLSIDEIKQFGQYWETKDELNKNVIYYWNVMIAPNGALVAFGAVNNPNNLDTREKLELIFHPMAYVIDNNTLPKNITDWGFSTVPSNLLVPLLKPDISIISLQNN